ncbi:GlxA family transcriptional regulator [Thalassospiraceae bacterium LMO-JJ14]|nr:GlxA family transcriptional regulator [Thalassospiraceae bacterium LMO-JJ14]
MQKVGFILIPGFALMSFASASEPLRAANLLAGQEHYRLSAYALHPDVARTSSGAQIPVQPLAAAGTDLDIVLVCAGGDPSHWNHPGVLDRLRTLARGGVRIGGISGGPYLVAAAGLLENRRFTIHWEHAPAFMEAFPDLVPEKSRYVIDGNRITCGGGVAPLDMMHALIAEQMGEDFARRVSDWFLHTHVGAGTESQKASLIETYGIHHPVLLSVLEKMESTPETPLDRATMARFAGVSERHLSRLFKAHLGATFQHVYLTVRIEYAGRLLRQSALTISEVAMATGFYSPSHFTKAYRALKGYPPSAERTRQPR